MSTLLRAQRASVVLVSVVAVTLASTLASGPASAVTGGADVNDGGYTFTVKLDIGDTDRSCSGALVHPQLVLTAASCLAGADGTLPTGELAVRTTATVGRANVASGTNGVVAPVNDVVGHPDRDLALARLLEPVTGVATIPLATSAPGEGDVLTFTGFGRTATEWVPGRMKYARFTVDSVDGTTFAAVPQGDSAANVCRGDAGGPAFRESGGTFELVGVHSTSTQAGCFGEPEGTHRATETRLDGLASWISDNAPGLRSGFEPADARPHWMNTEDVGGGGHGGTKDVGGINTTLTGAELKPLRVSNAHSGSQILLYSGLDNVQTGTSYAYLKAYQLLNMQVRSSTTLSYWIYPQSSAGYSRVTGDNSMCVAVDLVFKDGTTLRDSKLRDRQGRTAHPGGYCGNLTKDAWNEVTIDLGSLAGRTIDTVAVGYDQKDGLGGYRGYIDDLKISDLVAPPKFTTSVETGQPTVSPINTISSVAPGGGTKNVGGITSSLTGAELKPFGSSKAHTGGQVLLYSGQDNSADASFAYTKAFTLTNVFGTPTTRLSYWIYPQSKAGFDAVVDKHSTCVAADLIIVDQFDATKVSLRDAKVTDQRGVLAHPASQCGKLTLDAWNYVSVPLGAVANGKQITQVDVGYDQPLGKGGYRGFVDDVRITQ